MEELKKVIKALEAERKEATKGFGRADPYGRGYKAAMDRAISACKAARDGRDPMEVLG